MLFNVERGMQLSFENLYKDKFQEKIKIYQTNLIWKISFYMHKKGAEAFIKKGSTPLIVVIIAFILLIILVIFQIVI